MNKLTNAQIVEILSYATGENSIFSNKTMKFNTRFIWNLRKNIQRLVSCQEVFSQLQKEIFDHYSSDDYSVWDEEVQQRRIKDEYGEEYNQKITELYQQENELVINTVKVDEIFPPDSNEGLSIPEMNVLSFMIEDDENESVDKMETVI